MSGVPDIEHQPTSSTVLVKLSSMLSRIRVFVVSLFSNLICSDSFLEKRSDLFRHRQLLRMSESESMSNLQDMLLQKEIERRRSSSWLASVSELPFECTSCGKCCRTVGQVYLSPLELEAAATYTNSTIEDFIQTYAESKLDVVEGSQSLPWVTLRNVETERGPSCVFLDSETNHCQIYPVRPIQCSSYPFWTNILDTEYHWNNEVRRTDDDESSPMPPWTAETGGCEGMKPLDGPLVEGSGVPVHDALQQLSMYQLSERRMPRNGNFVQIEREGQN